MSLYSGCVNQENLAADARVMYSGRGYVEGLQKCRPEKEWVPQVCELAGTTLAKSGDFVALQCGPGRCLICTDLLGRRPLYYCILPLQLLRDDAGRHDRSDRSGERQWDRVKVRWDYSEPSPHVNDWVRHNPRQCIILEYSPSKGSTIRFRHSPLLDMLLFRANLLLLEDFFSSVLPSSSTDGAAEPISESHELLEQSFDDVDQQEDGGRAAVADPLQLSPFYFDVGQEEAAAGVLAKLLQESVREALDYVTIGNHHNSIAWTAQKQPVVGVLFSGGLDSCLLAKLLKDAGALVHLYTASYCEHGRKVPEDYEAAVNAARILDLPLHLHKIGHPTSTVAFLLDKLAPMIEDMNVVKAGVALTMACAVSGADVYDDYVFAMFSGLGSEEYLAGYSRFQRAGSASASLLGLVGLTNMWHRDLQREYVTVRHFAQIQMVLHPFLNARLLAFGIYCVGGKLKLSGDGSGGKNLLRLAALRLGLPEALVRRPRRSAQYGSGLHHALSRLYPKPGAVGAAATKLSAVDAVRCQPRSGHSVFAVLLSGTGGIFALRTAQLLRIPIACIVVEEGTGLPRILAELISRDYGGAPIYKRTQQFPKRPAVREGRGQKAMRALLNDVRTDCGVAGLILGAVSDLRWVSAVSTACDAVGLKLLTPVWGASIERFLVHSCRTRRAALVLRAPATAVAELPTVLLDGPEIAKTVWDVIKAHGADTDDEDSGVAEFFISSAPKVISVFSQLYLSFAKQRGETWCPTSPSRPEEFLSQKHSLHLDRGLGTDGSRQWETCSVLEGDNNALLDVMGGIRNLSPTLYRRRSTILELVRVKAPGAS